MLATTEHAKDVSWQREVATLFPAQVMGSLQQAVNGDQTPKPTRRGRVCRPRAAPSLSNFVSLTPDAGTCVIASP